MSTADLSMLIGTTVAVGKDGYWYYQGIVLDAAGEQIWSSNVAHDNQHMAELDAMDAVDALSNTSDEGAQLRL